jgi:hypothetical protein
VFKAGGGDRMNIHIVTGRRDTPVKERFIVGVFSSHEEANSAIEEAKKKMGNEFSFFTETRVLNQHIRYHGYEDSDDDISLEERVEALELYMNTAQRKILALEASLDNYSEGPSTEELRRRRKNL